MQSNEKINVEKAAGPDAYTVGEIYEKRAALNGKNVVLNGKVVKVSEGIMGKNWIHVQDGTGDSTKKTHNLVATTSGDLPAVGDVVTVKGTVSMDKDFGSGYRYNVIIENASRLEKIKTYQTAKRKGRQIVFCRPFLFTSLFPSPGIGKTKALGRLSSR